VFSSFFWPLERHPFDDCVAVNPIANERRSLVMKLATMPRLALGKISDGALLALVAGLGATAAMAGADATFAPALTVFTDYLEGTGGAIITVLSLAGGIIGMASGRFSLGQIAVPVGVGIGVGTGVPIVTAAITAVI
jgi:hypothetical protein